MDKQAKNSIDAMGTEPLGRLLLRYSLPPIVGMLVHALYNVVDRMFIGQGVGSLALAGVTLGFPIMIALHAVSVLVGVGANSLFSIRMGQGRREEAGRILGNATVLLFVFPTIAAVFCLWKLDWLLSFMGAGEAVLPYARDYARIVIFGAMFTTAGFGLTHFIRSDGHPKTAMISQLIGALANLLLDPLFIFGFRMGVAGAAWATVLAQLLSLIWCLAYFRSRRANTRLQWRDMRLDIRRIVWPFLALGTSSCLMALANVWVHFILNKGLSAYGGGHYGLAIIGNIMAFGSMVFMPVMGLSQGAQPLMGYNYGAGNLPRVWCLYGVTLLFGGTVMILGFIVSQYAPGYVMRVFSHGDEELVKAGAAALRLFSLALPVVVLPVMTGTLFQATGHPREAIILSVSRQIIFYIPALYQLPKIFLKKGWPPLDGIYLASPTSDFMAAVLSVYLLCRFYRRLNREAGTANPVG